jgi:hypothetical protein
LEGEIWKELKALVDFEEEEVLVVEAPVLWCARKTGALGISGGKSDSERIPILFIMTW